MLCINIISSSFLISKSRQLHDDFILVKGLDIHSLIFSASFRLGENVLCLQALGIEHVITMDQFYRP